MGVIMSGKVSGWVWDQGLPVHLKYILLAYADHADHDGFNVFPSRALIARKAGLDERTVRRSAAQLEDLGYLIDDGSGPKGTRRFRIPIEGVAPTPSRKSAGVTPADVGGDVDDLGDGAGDLKGVARASSEPSLDSSLDSSKNHGKFPKNDKTPLALAQAMLLNDMTGGKMYGPPPAEYERVYGRLRHIRTYDEEGQLYVHLEHPEPELLLLDTRIMMPLVRALAGILEPKVLVRITEEESNGEI